MSRLREEFLNRIFHPRRDVKWWENVTREVGGPASLQGKLGTELKDDFPEYRCSNRQLFFFTSACTGPGSSALAIDGRYRSCLGVEEKVHPLSEFKGLVDGAIHRGVIWVAGNPQNVSEPEAVTLSVLKEPGKKKFKRRIAELYLPILRAIYKFNVQVVYVNGETGGYWSIANHLNGEGLPDWVADGEPQKWDLSLEEVTQRNREGLRILESETDFLEFSRIPEASGNMLPGFLPRSSTLRCEAFRINDSCKIAICESDNEFRVIEHGLMLRAHGFDAVKVIYKRKNDFKDSQRTKPLYLAGCGVEKRVADFMRDNFSVLLQWETTN